VVGSGEIDVHLEARRVLFTRKILQLLTDDGRWLGVRFSKKILLETSAAVPVEIAGEPPPASE
jgi:hypothetical protein